MKKLVPICSLLLLLPVAFAQPRSPALQHLFYFDSSGSMVSRVGPAGATLRQSLARRLFSSSAILESSQVARVFRFTTRVMPVQGIPATAQLEALAAFVRNGWAITSEDTDLVRVLDDAVAAAHAQAGRVTLAWILTDNVNDPRGKGADVMNTRAFYEKLFHVPTTIRRLYFFPIPELKLVEYLLVISEDEKISGLEVDQFENALNAYGRSLNAPRIRAKPVGGEMPLEFDSHIDFEGAAQNVSAQVLGKGLRAQLVIDGLQEGSPLNGVFRLRLRSRFDEWRIEQATIERAALEQLESKDFPSIPMQLSARLTPSGITVDPRGASSVVYSLELGAVDTPLKAEAPFFTAAAFSPGATGTVRGRLSLRVADPKLKLKIFDEPALTRAVQQVFHLEDIEYFVPKALASEALRLDFSMPVEAHVAYRWWTRCLAVAITSLIILSAVYVLFSQGPKSLLVRIQGYSEAPITLTAKGAYRIAPSGKPIAELRLRRSGLSCQPLAPSLVNGRRTPVSLKRGGNVEIVRGSESYRYVIEILKQQAATRRPNSSGPGEYY
jgi:hypothetical protein